MVAHFSRRTQIRANFQFPKAALPVPLLRQVYELTNGIETPLLFIIEAIYFHRFKRLNKFIYSSFSWFINRAYNHILVYYHNLIFAMISSAYGTKYIHGINYQRSISDS